MAGDPAGAEVRVRLPAGLQQKAVSQALTSIELFVQWKMQTAARAAGLADYEIEPQLNQAKLEPETRDMLGELTPFICQEWGIEAEMSPTAAAALVLVPWGVNSAHAYLTLAELAAKRLALEAKREKEDKEEK